MNEPGRVEAVPVPPAAERESPGAALRRLRAQRGLALADVAGQLKYAVRQIEALEADDYSRLPGATFVRGMIRSYARLLDADALPLVGALDGRIAPAAQRLEPPAERIPFPDGSGRATRAYAGLGALALVAAAAFLYEWRTSAPAVPVRLDRPAVAVPEAVRQSPAPGSEAVSPAHTPAHAGSEGPNSDSDQGRLQLEFQKQSWVEIKDREGRVLLSQLNPAGSRTAVEGTPPFAVVIGNAANVRLIYNDSPVDLRPHVKIEVARLTLE